MPNRYVALFRGINVGRAKRIAMADLRKIVERLGFGNVTTLLNSGNVVFEGSAEDPEALAGRIRTAVMKKAGFDALVVVKTGKDIAAAIAGNKLGKVANDPSRLLVALTMDPKALARLAPLAKTDWKGEVVQVGKHAAYVWCANGILESKAGVSLLKDLADSGTTRNWATLEKIDALLRAG
jgi:uncharacterized protein (DUF1697 family)